MCADEFDHLAVISTTVQFRWEVRGAVGLDSDGKLVFPPLSRLPGVYQIGIHGGDEWRAYVGETDNLARRFAHYRNPGPSQRTNLRLNEVLRDHILKGGEADVAIAEGIEVDGVSKIDLATKPTRVLLESAALVDLSRRGVPVENL